ncbi:MAG: HAD family phosphatase [Ruminococcus sp.]|nr:HAD family phosphatase [Ruminococcus sp.]
MDITKIKAAIFDLDGTLLDSAYVWAEVDRQFLGRRGLELPHDYCKSICTMNLEQAAVYTKKRFALSNSIDGIIDEWKSSAMHEYRDNVQPFEGAYEFLALLKQRGIKTALATASDRVFYEPALKRTGLYELLDFFSQTSEVERGKGFPDVYLHAAAALGVKPADAAVFEDIPEGITGARAGGFVCVGALCGALKEEHGELVSLSDVTFERYSQMIAAFEG